MTDVTPLDVFSWREKKLEREKKKEQTRDSKAGGEAIIIIERHTQMKPHFLFSPLVTRQRISIFRSTRKKKTRKWGQNNDADLSFSSSQSEGFVDRFLLTGGWILSTPLHRRRCCVVKHESSGQWKEREKGMNFLQNLRAFKRMTECLSTKRGLLSQRIGKKS